MCPFNDPSVRLSLGPTITPNLLFDFAVVDEIGSVSVNDRAECYVRITPSICLSVRPSVL